MGKKKKEVSAITDTMLEQCVKPLNYKVNLKCKNQKQKELVNTIKKNQITIVEGVFGVGKTFVTNSVALDMLKNQEVEKIILISPTIENGGSEISIGLLPGDKMEKIKVYYEASIDTFEKILKQSNEDAKKIVNKLLSDNKIIYECANFVLGKTWDNTFIIIDEAENFNKQEMLLLLSRIGENSKMVISGDRLQTTRKSFLQNKDDSGFVHAINTLKDVDDIGIVQFTTDDIVRNKLIYKIYEKWKNQNC